MPIYEYLCKCCGSISEILCTGSQRDRQVKCKHCGSDQIEKILSAPSILKGGRDSHQLHGEHANCCGTTTPCDHPKRCCTEK